jgi:hypothetical protein
MEHRKAQRFDLRLPIELVRRRRLPAPGFGETRNVSSGGVLFKFTFEANNLRVGDALEYVISLPGPAAQFVRLHCLGKVIRIARNAAVAATIERYEFVRANSAAPERRASGHRLA